MMGIYAPHVEMPEKCVSCKMPCELWDYHADRPKDCPLRNVVKASANIILDRRNLSYPDGKEKIVEMELMAKLAEKLPEIWELEREETRWGPFGEVHISATIYLVDNQGGTRC